MPAGKLENHQKNSIKKVRPSLVGEELLVKIKEAIIGIRLTGNMFLLQTYEATA